jgi:hypothetical protein
MPIDSSLPDANDGVAGMTDRQGRHESARRNNAQEL